MTKISEFKGQKRTK